MRKSARLRYMTDPNPEGTPGATPPAPRTFTQDEVTGIATREKNDGRAAALREVADKLGGLSLDDAAALIEAARKADEANQTQAQRDAAAAATARAEAERIQSEAAADRHAARVERLLGSAGASNVAIATRALEVAVGADEAAVTAAIEKLKADAPGLFGATPPPHTDPGTPPNTRRRTRRPRRRPPRSPRPAGTPRPDRPVVGASTRAGQPTPRYETREGRLGDSCARASLPL